MGTGGFIICISATAQVSVSYFLFPVVRLQRTVALAVSHSLVVVGPHLPVTAITAIVGEVRVVIAMEEVKMAIAMEEVKTCHLVAPASVDVALA